MTGDFRPPIRAKALRWMKASARLLICFLLLCSCVSRAGPDDTVTHLTDGSSDRQPLQTVIPIYPERALRERIEGVVEVCFAVDREGNTSRIAVRHSSNRIFEQPAIQAVRGSSYRPLDDDKPLSGIKTCRTFRFTLDPIAVDNGSDDSDLVDP